MSGTGNIAAEVRWGVSQELRVLARYLGVRIVKGEDKADYDFRFEGPDGMPVAYFEVKVRRSALKRFGDAMFPWRKYLFARSLPKGVPFIGITEYACGALVEVDLRKRPAQRRPVARRDRPTMVPVDHGLYSGRQVNVLQEGT